jgi:hypothetical protein
MHSDGQPARFASFVARERERDLPRTPAASSCSRRSGPPVIVLCNELVEGHMPRFDKLSAQEFPLLDLDSRW